MSRYDRDTEEADGYVVSMHGCGWQDRLTEEEFEERCANLSSACADDSVAKTTNDHLIETMLFIAEAEERIVRRFIEIAEMGNELDKASDSDADRAMIGTEFAKRGYKITSTCKPDDGIAWRWVLLHDGKEVAYNVIEVSVGDTRWTGYGMGMR